MGREAVTQVEYAGRSGQGKVLLESEGLILRAPLSARIPRDGISDLAVDGEALTGFGPDGAFRLSLGATEAARWKAALEKPLPTLAEKLGLKPGVTVWTSGDFDTPELATALSGVARVAPATADLRLIRAESLGALMRGLDESAVSSAPVWIVHGKGRAAALGDNAVRQVMRDLGHVDVKVSAVSADLSATRYVKR
jgi:hypothetical protein